MVLELSLIQFNLLCGEFSAFSATSTVHNFSIFRSTRYPSLLGGQIRYGMRGFAQHLYTSINFSDLWELVNLPCATIGVGDCGANQSYWHKALWVMIVHLDAQLLMHTSVQPLSAISTAVCGAALSPPGNDRFFSIGTLA